jgi:glycosyltransferase involved in cell wall biosynthesis
LNSTHAIASTIVKRQQFSIIIPAWNESDYIEATLDATKKAIAQLQHQGEIIVVDNNSTDNTASLATNSGARVVFEPINQIARARNTGARASESEWLIFVDADSIISAELLNASLHALSSGSAIGGGSTVAMNPEINGLPGAVLKFWNWWSVKTYTAAGCYIFCTREAFDAVGQFDERQYAAEELYLSKQLKKLAKKRGQQFLIHTHAPIVSSSRKVNWYSPRRIFKQVLLLLIPGATRSRNMCFLWYDRDELSQGKLRGHSKRE